MESSPTASRAPLKARAVHHVSGVSGSGFHGDDVHVDEMLALDTLKAA